MLSHYCPLFLVDSNDGTIENTVIFNSILKNENDESKTD